MVLGSSPVTVTSPSEEFLDIQATIECGFTLKRARDMIRRYSQMHRTDKYSEHSSIIWSVWPNGGVFVYELSGWFWVRVQLQSLEIIIVYCSHSKFTLLTTIFFLYLKDAPPNELPNYK